MSVLWSCQFAASASTVALKNWQAIGRVEINQGDPLVKAFEKAFSAPTMVVKVSYFVILFLALHPIFTYIAHHVVLQVSSPMVT